MMEEISVLDGASTLLVGHAMTRELAADVVRCVVASTYVIVTDENIARHSHLRNLETAMRDALSQEQRRVLTLVLPPGEAAKTREVKASIEDWMLDHKCTRDSCLIALGGGVIGDMIGFVAATFMRGVPVIQIPTTLLAMVDSSVGGKTAVDTPHGKNLIGAFHQPRRVFIDIQYLRTLPHREFVNGMAEVIKTAAIWDAEDFALLENQSEKILALSSGRASPDAQIDHTLLLRVILGSVKVKAHVVTVDEKETGLRGLLNFGHTVGHAFEAILAPELLHGECVSIGMVKEAEIARNLGHLRNVDVGRLIRCLKAYDLPVSADDARVRTRAPGKHCPVDKLMDIMRVDKKNQGDKKRVVLLAAIGRTVEPKASFVQDDVIRKVLSPAVRIEPHVRSESPREITLSVPGSKSISNRALVLAALGEGVCRLRGLLFSDDVQVMLDALHHLVGITYDWEDDGDTLVLTGGAGRLMVPEQQIYLGNAGTAARFLTTVCCLARPRPNSRATEVFVTGNQRMKQRPIGPLVDALRSNGCDITYAGTNGCLPLSIKPSSARDGAGLKGGHIKLSASISSQYVSSILLSAPYAEEQVTLELVGGAVISQPYIDMTIAMMETFGISVKRNPGTDIYVVPKGVYKNPAVYHVEADASSATYPLAFAAMTGTRVTVSNIGARSLQGDAEFAVKVLRPMGCTVTQTATTTTVQGPAPLSNHTTPTLLPLPTIDMESMTDAFLTASVLAAIASPSSPTRITGIANQRVKECNRIKAVADNLALFGVTARELEDGLEIDGVGGGGLRPPTQSMECHDDHRVAMSFSLLCAAVGGVVGERKCVEKTWPGWWDTLEGTLNVGLIGAEEESERAAENKASSAAEKSQVPEFIRRLVRPADDLSDQTVVFIGMRGAGKTHMGLAAARALGRHFIDMDAHFEARQGCKIPAFLERSTWDDFRRVEVEMLREVLEAHPTDYIVSCGGGIVETAAGMAELRRWGGDGAPRRGHVVHITRDIEDIIKYLSVDTTRPLYGDDVRETWKRRGPLYTKCSSSEFHILRRVELNEGWDAAERDLVRFLKFILSTRRQEAPSWNASHAPPTSPHDSSFFLSLTFPDISEAIGVLDEASRGVDALELRVDLLASLDEIFVARQVALIRRVSELPIIFTVRTASQGGRFSDADADGMFALLNLGVRLGCEFVDVEVPDNHDAHRLTLLEEFLAARGNAHVIASYHDVSGTAIWDELGAHGSGLGGAGPSSLTAVRMKNKYADMHRFGDTIKLIGRASKLEDCFAVHRFLTQVVPSLNLSPRKPTIALVMGPLGQSSRVLNSYLTPITHPSLPAAAAPGQLSLRQIYTARNLMGLLPAYQFHLFGSPISASMSPTLHNAGFEALGLPHKYILSECENVALLAETVRSQLSSGNFGGASVTIPHKETVLKVPGLITTVTDAVMAIGAVNTLVPLPGCGGLLGDNTDWLGIRNSVVNSLGSGGLNVTSSFDEVIGLVIGAGGTSRAAVYALKSLGCGKIRIWNRTAERAREVAESSGVGDDVVAVDGPLEDLIPVIKSSAAVPATRTHRRLSVVVATVPGQAQEEMRSSWDALISRVEASARQGSACVAVELAYRPRRTAFLKAVDAAAASGGGLTRWSAVEGVEVLVEQGLEQFVRWTGRKAPASVMRAAVYDRYV